MVYVIEVQEQEFVRGEYQHPKRLLFPKEAQHHRLTFAMESWGRLVESGRYRYVILKDGYGNPIEWWEEPRYPGGPKHWSEGALKRWG